MSEQLALTAEDAQAASDRLTIDLRDYQLDAVERAREAIRGGARNVLIVAPTGSGKCLGRGTPVLMFDGSIKAVEDVVAGDALMGPDSKPRRVLSTTAGIGPLFRVTPSKGDPYIVNDAHILSLKMTGGATKWDCSRSDTYRAGKLHNISVTDFLSRSKTFRHCAKGWRTGVEFAPAKEPLPLPAYFVGAWLGDGLSKGPAVCSADSEILAAVIDLAHAHGLTTRIEYQARNLAVTMHITGGMRGGAENAVRSALSDLGLIQNKHIPRAYLTASRGDRLELLAGLIDTDGSLSSGGFDFVQKSEVLSRQVAYLARSLGLAAYVSPSRKTCGNNDKPGDYWRVSISGDCSVIPTRIARKRAPKRQIKKDPLLVGLSVEPIGEGEYFGFEIDGDRLFLLGDFTVTHNTVIGSYLIQEAKNKGRRANFVVDRLSLIQQTSDTFDRYGLDHGVHQASHWRAKPWLQVQLCSVQTLARRGWPTSELDIVDEAHTLHETHIKRISERSRVVVGLTATPFTKGLGKHFDAVINVTTTDALIEQGFLVPYRIFGFEEPDMTDVDVNSLGEWDSDQTSKKALEVVGDVVAEYQKHGEGRKFMVSAVDTAHVEELQRQFLAAGIPVATYTYKDDDEDRADTVQEFRRPDSKIRGLITVTAASKGFDVADIGYLAMARPLRKSLAEFIQFMGRGLRISPETGKVDCIIADHSGNCVRFWKQFRAFFRDGVLELDDGTKREKKKAEDTEPEPMKCPSCGHMHNPRPVCPVCGHEYPRKKAVEHVPGTLKELVATKDSAMMRKHLWPQVCAYVLAKGNADMLANQRRAQGIYFGLTGQTAHARIENTTPQQPTREVLNKIRANNIRFAKGREKSRAVA